MIGGGITGTGIALDAATRGLRVALVEKHDLAFGTSRWSSKLVHGGLRYLATGNVGIARRSAIERGILMTRNAPHLVQAMPQLVPLLPSMGHGQRALVRAGFLAGTRCGCWRARRLDPAALALCRREACVELAPTVRRDGLDGGLLAYDGQLIDDARLVTAVARTAAQHGARILTRVAASEATGTSVRLTDQRTGESFDVSAGAVINAAGVWAGEVDTSFRLRPSRGTHLVFDAKAFGNPTAALTVPIPGELNRFVFAMPEQLGRVYLGLTDEDAPGPIPDVPNHVREEISFLLDTVNTALDVALATGRRDRRICGTAAADRHRGRPHRRRVARPRRRRVAAGVISVIGGKLTEYRFMAEDVLDRAITLRGLRAAAAGPATCRWSGRRPIRTGGGLGRPPCRRRWSRAMAPRHRTSSPAPAASARPSRSPTASTSPGPNSNTRSPMKARWTSTTSWIGGPESAWCGAIASGLSSWPRSFSLA